jgi:heptaprenyl diphosphate synthase
VTAVRLGYTFADAELEASVIAGMGSVETALTESVAAEYDFLADVAKYGLDAGGKRFRPLLAILAAHLGDPKRPEVIRATVVIELTHLASLYHDDVMDEAVVRRGVQTPNARWDNSVAILTGDFLFSRASDIMSELGPDAVRLQARTFARLVTGQIRETVGVPEGADPLRHYLTVLEDKTGSLIAAAAQFGAMFAGAPDDVVEAARRYGEQIGVAFQLSDDILDVVADPDASGKVPGTDLREGVPTLPTLYALQSTDAADARLRDLVSRPLTEDAEVAEALTLLRASRAIASARDTVAQYAAAARAELAVVPDSPARTALLELTRAVVERTG